MFKKLLVFGAGTLLGAGLAKSCIIIGAMINELGHREEAKKAEESETTKEES